MGGWRCFSCGVRRCMLYVVSISIYLSIYTQIYFGNHIFLIQTYFFISVHISLYIYVCVSIFTQIYVYVYIYIYK